MRIRTNRVFRFAAALSLLLSANLAAQGPGDAQGAGPRTARATAPDDVTGYWVSVVTEDWHVRYRATGERLEPGAGWSRVCRRGTALTLVDLEGGANVPALLYRAEDPLERYCMPDTLKCQHTAKLTVGPHRNDRGGMCACGDHGRAPRWVVQQLAVVGEEEGSTLARDLR